jgi:hypothetical protein
MLACGAAQVAVLLLRLEHSARPPLQTLQQQAARGKTCCTATAPRISDSSSSCHHRQTQQQPQIVLTLTVPPLQSRMCSSSRSMGSRAV